MILIAAGVLVLGPGDRPSAEISRWIGIIAAALAAISAIFVMPYYPVWSLIYIAIAIMVIYGLSARYGEQAADSRPPAAGGRDPAAEQASHPGPDRQRRCSTPLALVPGPTCESYLFRGDGRPMDGELPSGE